MNILHMPFERYNRYCLGDYLVVTDEADKKAKDDSQATSGISAAKERENRIDHCQSYCELPGGQPGGHSQRGEA